jgi:hypothetical protein
MRRRFRRHILTAALLLGAWSAPLIAIEPVAKAFFPTSCNTGVEAAIRQYHQLRRFSRRVYDFAR